MWLWLGFAAILVGTIYLLTPILTPFLISFLAAYLLDPIVETLNKYGVGRTWGSLIAVCLFVLIVLGALGAGTPYLVQEAAGFSEKLPGYKERFEQEAPPVIEERLGQQLDIDFLAGQLPNYSERIAITAGNMLQNLAFSTMAIIDFISYLLIVPLVVFYLLKDWPYILNTLKNLLPKKWQKGALSLVKDIDESLSGFLRGQTLVCLSLGIFYGVSLWLLGLELGLFLGLFMGLLTFIPVVGGLIGTAFILLFALVQYQFALEPYLWLAAIFAIGALLENFALTPYLVGSRVGLNPVWIIFAIMAGGELGGLGGMIVAMPVATILVVIIPKIAAAWRNSSVYKQGKAT